MSKHSIRNLLLGSASTRRKEILSFFHYPFSIRTSSFNEASISDLGDPEKLCKEIALGKANAFTLEKDEVVLTADTIVYFNNRAFHKPRDVTEAASFIRTLSGNWHTVYTGVTIRDSQSTFTECAATRVLFRSLSDDQIARYVAAVSPLDKAGGYAIQGSGSIVVERIEGCYYNVMGLPLQLTASLLMKMGIDVWDFLRP